MTDLQISELQHRIALYDDERAYHALFVHLAPSLIRFAFTICHNWPEAEEIASDVFIRIWEKRKTLDHILNLKLYLYVATRNFSINRKKSADRNETLRLSDLKVELQTPLIQPDTAIEIKELYELFHEAVNALPPQAKIVYKLVKEDGLKHKEVAELLHLQQKTVENHLAIALRKLSAVLTGFQLRRNTKGSSASKN